MKGLVNFGNTCYFNSIIQCLLQVPQLSNYIMSKRDFVSLFLKEYQLFARSFWLDKNNMIEDHSKIIELFIEQYPQFNNADQHDCQETFIFLLDIFEKEIKDFIDEVFYFDSIQETVCKSENSKKIEKTNITMLFPEKQEQCLLDLIKKNQEWDVLEGFVDSKDHRHHVATTRTLFNTSPRILVFSIKMYTRKYKTSLPETFDLNNFIHPDSKCKKLKNNYYLFGACSHKGSLNGGHYISYTRHKGDWYIKDDTRCKKIEKVNLCDYFYIIFYKRI